VADWPEKRAELIAHYANYLLESGYHGEVRLSAGKSSFAIPDRDVSDPIWLEREGKEPRSEYHRHCLREERRALERHARGASGGSWLILDPLVIRAGKAAGDAAHYAR